MQGHDETAAGPFSFDLIQLAKLVRRSPASMYCSLLNPPHTCCCSMRTQSSYMPAVVWTPLFWKACRRHCLTLAACARRAPSRSGSRRQALKAWT